MKHTITAGTVTRTLLLLLALVNQAAAAFGCSVLPIENETISQMVSTLFTAGVSIWAWWKNNSLTKAAQEADRYKNDLKSGELTRQERQ